MTPVDPAFPGAYTFVLGLERGWHDGGTASDPNPTLDGVTQRTYAAWRTARDLPVQSVQQMSEEERFEVYRQFWDESQAALLPTVARMTRIAHFAFFFNARPKSARQALQRALRVRDDGDIGPVTRAAMAAATDADTFPRLLVAQMEHYYDLALNPRLRPNLTSWIGRLVAAWRLP